MQWCKASLFDIFQIAHQRNIPRQQCHSVNSSLQKDMGETSRIYVNLRKQWRKKVTHRVRTSLRKRRKADATATVSDMVESIALHHDIKVC